MTTNTTMNAPLRCEHYWREGVLRVERGQADPHRDECLDCRREHEARAALVRGLQQVGVGAGDPRWQAKVWAQLDRERDRRLAAQARPAWAPWATAFAAACALVMFVQLSGLFHREGEGGGVVGPIAKVAIAPAGQVRALRAEPAPEPARSLSAAIGEHVQAWIAPRQEVRIYRGEGLIARCAEAMPASPRCAHVGAGTVVDQILELPGTYRLVVAPAAILEGPRVGEAASIDRDLAALTAGGVGYEQYVITVR